MKKIISIILVVCFVFSLSSFCYALDDNKEYHINREWFSAEEIANSQFIYEKYLEKGEAILSGNQRNTWASLNVSLILQTDSRWNNVNLPCGHSNHKYGNVGCAMTSYSMVMNYYGNSTTPITVAETYQANRGTCCNFSSSLLVRDYSGRSTEPVPNVSTKSYSEIKTVIIGALFDGYPVVVKVDTDSNGYNHFVVCYAYVITTTGDIRISIRDPLGTYTYLDQYNNIGREPVSVVIVM